MALPHFAGGRIVFGNMIPKLRLQAALALLLSIPPAFAGDSLSWSRPEIPLWPNGAPGSEGHASAEKWNPSTDGFHRITNINNPSITVFLPPTGEASGTGVIVCPGGAHRYLVMDLEGSMVAERLNSMGIAAFVLKSRLARAPGSTYKVEDSLADAQQAMRLVRSRASEWNIKPNRVGIMGFSAGGEIAALAETRFTGPETRPDFAVLAYPGVHPDNMTIPKGTPPTFLVVADDDKLATAVAAYYGKLKTQGVPAEVHIYAKGGHGFGMTGRTTEFRSLEVSHWPEALQAWLSFSGFLNP